jgi:hypothetical protein
LAGRGAAGPNLREYCFADQERVTAGAGARLKQIADVTRGTHSSLHGDAVDWSRNEVAADEVTPELLRGVHDGEAAGCRIDDKVARLGNGGDQPSDGPIGLICG